MHCANYFRRIWRKTLKQYRAKILRPTTDKIKESLFNILGGYFDGGVMLDMYSGSGAVAIEAVSRGMDRAFLFENNRLAQRRLSKILRLQNPEQFHLKRQNVKQGLKTIASDPAFEPFELVFMDPPYRLQEIVKGHWAVAKSWNLVFSDCVDCLRGWTRKCNFQWRGRTKTPGNQGQDSPVAANP